MSDEMKVTTRYIPITDWEQYHPWPTASGIRNRIYKKDKDGFNCCVVRVGKRVLIDETAFFKWVENGGE